LELEPQHPRRRQFGNGWWRTRQVLKRFLSRDYSTESTARLIALKPNIEGQRFHRLTQDMNALINPVRFFS
jgi:hypothetical protein